MTEETVLETSDYAIEQSREAYVTLLDSIYVHKEESVVRETMANALDGHIKNGNPDEMFIVHAPTVDEPWFLVRDFGTGLDHTVAMVQYTTLFYSDKRKDGKTTGSFGLGSKVIFCYAQSFSIRIWKDGELRCYRADFPSDELPRIDFLSREPSTERSGIEIKVGIRPESINLFQNKIISVSAAFPVLPDCNIALPQPTVFYSGVTTDGHPWRVVQGSADSIRQGCVIYPVPDNHINLGADRTLTGDYRVQIDVPIDTVDVTANREALDMKPGTKATATRLLKEAHTGALEQFEKAVANAPLWRMAKKIATDGGSLFNSKAINSLRWKGKPLGNVINLNDDLPPGMPPFEFELGTQTGNKEKRRTNPHFSWYDIQNGRIRIIIDDGTKVVRRGPRIKDYRIQFARHDRNYLYVMINAQPAQVSRMKHLLGDKITCVRLQDLPDNHVAAPKSVAPKRIQGVYRGKWKGAVQEIPTDYRWLEIGDAGICQMGHGLPNFYLADGQTLDRITRLVGWTGEVLSFSAAAIKRHNPPGGLRLDTALLRAVVSREEDYYLAIEEQSFEAGSERMAQIRWRAAGALPARDMSLPTNDAMVLKFLDADRVAEAKELGGKARRAISELYPLLFNQAPDDAQITDYINMVDQRNKQRGTTP